MSDYATVGLLDTGVINGWVDRNTQGLIPKVLDSIDPTDVMCLVSVTYMKAMWEKKFDTSPTRASNFMTDRGETKFIPMMNQETNHRYFSDDGFQSLEMAYTNKDLVFGIYLPGFGSTREEYF